MTDLSPCSYYLTWNFTIWPQWWQQVAGLIYFWSVQYRHLLVTSWNLPLVYNRILICLICIPTSLMWHLFGKIQGLIFLGFLFLFLQIVFLCLPASCLLWLCSLLAIIHPNHAFSGESVWGQRGKLKKKIATTTTLPHPRWHQWEHVQPKWEQLLTSEMVQQLQDTCFCWGFPSYSSAVLLPNSKHCLSEK